MKKPLSKGVKALLITLLVIAIIGACGTAVALYAKSTITEGTVDLSDTNSPKIEPVSEEQFPTYINGLIEKAKDTASVKINVEPRLEFDKDSLETDLPDADLAVAKYIIGNLTGKLDGIYTAHSGDFGDGFSELPTVINAKASEFKSEMIEETDDNGTVLESHRCSYTFIVNAADTAEDFFDVQRAEQAFDKLTKDAADMLEVKSMEILPQTNTVECTADHLTDTLERIAVKNEYKCTFEVRFVGDYASLGEKTLSFIYRAQEDYNFSWASIDIMEETVKLNLNEEEELDVSAVISDNATDKDYKLSFTSSDESVVTVDKDGFIKGMKISDKPVTVTITLEYLGKTYTDTCEVWVLVAVEKVKTAPEKASLAVGQTQKLTCNITPEDATIKNVLWFTEDEKIAAVTADGTVTAKSKGTVKVYAVSVDGNFRSSCEVEVK